MNWADRLRQLTSRKFLVTLSAEAGLLTALFSTPVQANWIAELILRVGTLAGMVLVALGYVRAEARLDEANI